MNKKDRIHATIAGEKVDRVPVSWYTHFPDMRDNTVSDQIAWAKATDMDIRMPFMDGLALAHEVRKRQSETYIVILSAYGDFRKAQQAMKENVYRYLLKPVNPQEFRQVISEAAKRIEEQKTEKERLTDLEEKIRSYRRQAETENTEMKETEIGTEESKRVSHAVNLALEMIHSEYASRLGLNDVAERVYMTPAYFSTIFRKEMGESFVHYLNNYRLEKAASALVNTNRPAGEIRKDSGFSGDSYFIMLFRNRYGCTPHQYRSSPENRGDKV